MDTEIYNLIEKLVDQHKELHAAHLHVISVIDELAKTHLGNLDLVKRNDLCLALYKTAGNHFHPLKDSVRAQLGDILTFEAKIKEL